MKDNKEFIKGIYEKYDEYLKEERGERKMDKENNKEEIVKNEEVKEEVKNEQVNEQVKNEQIENESKKFTPVKNVKTKEFKNGKVKRHNFVKFLSAAAVFAIVISSVMFSKNFINEQESGNETKIGKTTTSDKITLNTVNDFQNFYNIVKENSDKNQNNNRYYSIDDGLDYAIEDSINSAEQAVKSSDATTSMQTENKSDDYSKTNIQVENVDEADIVKTNGKYIFYVLSKKILIVDIQDKAQMKKVAEISFENDNFTPSELYINNDKLILLGNERGYSTSKNIIKETINSIYKKGIYKQKTVAIVYDINKIEDPKEDRRVEIEGNYVSSRLIDNNIYFVSNKSIAAYDIVKQDINDLNENNFKPTYKDTISSTREKTIGFDCIYYFEHIDTLNYLTLGGFSLNGSKEVDVKTFLGAGEDIYCSTENMYVVKTKNVYDADTRMNFGKDTKILKFSLNNGEINFKAEADIEGGINNQFSMDEKDGYFRIATTIGKTYNMDNSTSNSLYILDQDLKEVGLLEGIAKGEKIYSVRYAGDKAYVVTFKEIDPLFVIDLKDVKNPKILGELKIPGYSTYLHPYDETHIIGFGYDTKPNASNTGVVNDGLKMSMFDITDYNNPKEMFTIKIGEKGTSSPLTNNHKALLFSKEKNMIAFPVTSYLNGKTQYKAQVYDIDLTKGFTLRGEIEHKKDEEDNKKYYSNYKLSIDRIIYSNDVFYTLSKGMIKASDMETVKELTKIDIE